MISVTVRWLTTAALLLATGCVYNRVGGSTYDKLYRGSPEEISKAVKAALALHGYTVASADAQGDDYLVTANGSSGDSLTVRIRPKKEGLMDTRLSSEVDWRKAVEIHESIARELGVLYRDALARGQQRYKEAGAEVVLDEFLRPRFGPGYRSSVDQAVPGAFHQAVADAGTWFEQEIPGLRDWTFGEAEVRRITQPVLAVLGGESDALWPRFGETHRLLLWLPHAEGFVLPKAAHGLQMQNPKGMAEALAGFWARHPVGP